MAKLVLTLGPKVGWAVHHEDKATKIKSGCYTFKSFEDEDKNLTYERFYLYLKELIYSHNPIDVIYYQESHDGEYTLYRKCIEYILLTCEENGIDSCKIKTKESIYHTLKIKDFDKIRIMDSIKAKDYKPEGLAEACAITTALYVSTNS